MKRNFLTFILLTALGVNVFSQTGDSIAKREYLAMMEDQDILLSASKRQELEKKPVINFKKLRNDRILRSTLESTFLSTQKPRNAENTTSATNVIHGKSLGYIGSVVFTQNETIDKLNSVSSPDIYFLDNYRQFGLVSASDDGTSCRININSENSLKFVNRANITGGFSTYFNAAVNQSSTIDKTQMKALDIAVGDFSNRIATLFEKIRTTKCSGTDFAALYDLNIKYKTNPSLFNSNSRVIKSFNGLCYRRRTGVESTDEVKASTVVKAGGNFQFVSVDMDAEMNWTYKKNESLKLEDYQIYIFKTPQYDTLPNPQHLYYNWVKLSDFATSPELIQNFDGNDHKEVNFEFGPVPLIADKSQWVGLLKLSCKGIDSSSFLNAPVAKFDAFKLSDKAGYINVPIDFTINQTKFNAIVNRQQTPNTMLTTEATCAIYYNTNFDTLPNLPVKYTKTYNPITFTAQVKPTIEINGNPQINTTTTSAAPLKTSGVLTFKVNDLQTNEKIQNIAINTDGVSFRFASNSNPIGNIKKCFSITNNVDVVYNLHFNMDSTQNIFSSSNPNYDFGIPISIITNRNQVGYTRKLFLKVVGSNEFINYGDTEKRNNTTQRNETFKDGCSLIAKLPDNLTVGDRTLAELKVKYKLIDSQSYDCNAILDQLRETKLITISSIGNVPEFSVPNTLLVK